MNEQFKPLENTTPVNNSGFSQVEPKTPPKEDPIKQVVNQSNEDIVKNLPDWNLEPPVEINRGLS